MSNSVLTQQQKILILTAIPHGLRLDKEIREIEEAIRRAAKRDLFEIRIRTAVRSQDIRRAIAEEQPQIVHFCGHGMEDGSLLLEDEGGNNKPVSPEALASLFKLHVDYVKCVLLNACYSEKPAVTISQYIDRVIGMNNPIQDRAAIEFARGFYDGLGYKISGNQDVFQRAFDEAMVAIQMENLSQGQMPVLKKKDLKTDYSIQPFKFDFDVVTLNTQGQEIKRSRHQSWYLEENLGNEIVLEMVWIPGGTFQMGSPEGEGNNWEKPQHQVKVQPFFMGKYPVTQAQWRAIASLPKVNRYLNPEPSRFRGDKRPVERVSWYGAVEFCERLSKKTGREYRLPSEAEWEYACRAGTTTPFHFGSKITREVVNCKRNLGMAFMSLFGIGETTEVGSFKVANAFGLYDMHGNVCERCADTWHDNYVGTPDDGSAWTEGGDYNRSPLRGGSWCGNPRDCRSAFRSDVIRERGPFNSVIGFRVVCGVGRTH